MVIRVYAVRTSLSFQLPPRMQTAPQKHLCIFGSSFAFTDTSCSACIVRTLSPGMRTECQMTHTLSDKQQSLKVRVHVFITKPTRREVNRDICQIK